MKVTLDHNCLIHIKQNSPEGQIIKSLLNQSELEFYVVNIGSSELRQGGIRPDSYSTFEDFLNKINLHELSRLNPMGLVDITFFDYCIFADQPMVDLSKEIKSILFTKEIENDSIIEQPPFKPIGRKWLNRICDTHSLWCHIHYGNDIFLTSDRNFLKKTKKPKLVALGAKQIMLPEELNAQYV